ncbi:MAG: DUF2442 domain-containing protein [Deltaproteobacteria bacterium]|nr:DUF2442 domain-containing protein [Deltaproteobacteria bacterium]
MKLQKLGKNTSEVEITHISTNGIWVLVSNKEYFLSFQDYPWFKDAKIFEIHSVTLLHDHILHWSHLDVDLDLESLDFPEKYPLVYK